MPRMQASTHASLLTLNRSPSASTEKPYAAPQQAGRACCLPVAEHEHEPEPALQHSLKRELVDDKICEAQRAVGTGIMCVTKEGAG